MAADLRLQNHYTDEWADNLTDQWVVPAPDIANDPFGLYQLFRVRARNTGDTAAKNSRVAKSKHTGSIGDGWVSWVRMARPKFPRIHTYMTRFTFGNWANFAGTRPAVGTEMTLVILWMNTLMVDLVTVQMCDVTILGSIPGHDQGIFIDSNFPVNDTHTDGLRWWPGMFSDASMCGAFLVRKSDGSYWRLYNQAGSWFQQASQWYNAATVFDFPGHYFWWTPYIQGPYTPPLPLVGSRRVDTTWDELQLPLVAPMGYHSLLTYNVYRGMHNGIMHTRSMPVRCWTTDGVLKAGHAGQFMVSVSDYQQDVANPRTRHLSWGNPYRFNLSAQGDDA